LSVYLQVILTLVVIIFLILIYRRSDKNEEFLFLKLIGYYFLGAFRFNFNEFAVPLGFIVYLIAFRPKINIQYKKVAAVIGLVVFAVGVALPKYNDYLFTKPIKVSADSVNLFDNSLNQDWESIKEKLKVNDIRMNDFQVEFEKDGKVKSLRYQLIGNKDGLFVYYDIDFVPYKEAYVIRPGKTNQWIQYPRLISADHFFSIWRNINAREIVPQTEYPFYVAQIKGSISNYDSKNTQNLLLLSKQGVKGLGQEDLPMTGLNMTVFWMVHTSKNSAGSTEAKYYVLSL
jgi:hypothetical protein